MIEKRPPRLIEGPRIRLQAREVSQAEELFHLIDRNRDELRPWMVWEERTQTVKDSQAFIEGMIEGWQFGDEYDYSIVLKKTGAMIGSFGFHTVDAFSRNCHLGFWLSKESQGKGYVTEAVKLGEEVARKLGFHRLIMTCNRLNTKSRAVAQRNGYRQESLLIDHTFERGQWRDTCFFGKLINADPNLDHLPADFSFQRQVLPEGGIRLEVLSGEGPSVFLEGHAKSQSHFLLGKLEIAKTLFESGLEDWLLNQLWATEDFQKVEVQVLAKNSEMLKIYLKNEFQIQKAEEGQITLLRIR